MSQDTLLTSDSSRGRKSRWEKVLMSKSQTIDRISHAILTMANCFTQFQDELNAVEDVKRITELMVDAIELDKPEIIPRFLTAFNVIVRSTIVTADQIVPDSIKNYRRTINYIREITSSNLTLEKMECCKALCASLFVLIQDSINSSESTSGHIITHLLEEGDSATEILSILFEVAGVESRSVASDHLGSNTLIQMRRDAIDASNSLFGFLRVCDSKKLLGPPSNRRKMTEISLTDPSHSLSHLLTNVLLLFRESDDSLCLPGCTELLWRACRHLALEEVMKAENLEPIEKEFPGILRIVKETPVAALEKTVRSHVASLVATMASPPRLQMGTAFVEISLLRDADQGDNLSIHPLLQLAARVEVGRHTLQVVGVPLPVETAESSAVSIRVFDALTTIANEGGDLSVGGAETIEIPWRAVGRILSLPGIEPVPSSSRNARKGAMSRRVSIVMSTAEMQSVIKTWTGHESVALVDEINSLTPVEAETCLFQVVLDGFAGAFSPLNILMTLPLSEGQLSLISASDWLIHYLRSQGVPEELLAEEEDGFESVAIREQIANCTPRMRTPSVRSEIFATETGPAPLRSVYRQPHSSSSRKSSQVVSFATTSSVVDFVLTKPSKAIADLAPVEVHMGGEGGGRTPPVSDGVARAKWEEEQKRKKMCLEDAQAQEHQSAYTETSKTGPLISYASTKYLQQGFTEGASEPTEEELEEQEETRLRADTPMPTVVPVASQEEEEEEEEERRKEPNQEISTANSMHSQAPLLYLASTKNLSSSSACEPPEFTENRQPLFSTPPSKVSFDLLLSQSLDEQPLNNEKSAATANASESSRNQPATAPGSSPVVMDLEVEMATQTAEDIIIDPSVTNPKDLHGRSTETAQNHASQVVSLSSTIAVAFPPTNSAHDANSATTEAPQPGSSLLRSKGRKSLFQSHPLPLKEIVDVRKESAEEKQKQSQDKQLYIDKQQKQRKEDDAPEPHHVSPIFKPAEDEHAIVLSFAANTTNRNSESNKIQERKSRNPQPQSETVNGDETNVDDIMRSILGNARGRRKASNRTNEQSRQTTENSKKATSVDEGDETRQLMMVPFNGVSGRERSTESLLFSREESVEEEKSGDVTSKKRAGTKKRRRGDSDANEEEQEGHEFYSRHEENVSLLLRNEKQRNTSNIVSELSPLREPLALTAHADDDDDMLDMERLLAASCERLDLLAATSLNCADSESPLAGRKRNAASSLKPNASAKKRKTSSNKHASRHAGGDDVSIDLSPSSTPSSVSLYLGDDSHTVMPLPHPSNEHALLTSNNFDITSIKGVAIEDDRTAVQLLTQVKLFVVKKREEAMSQSTKGMAAVEERIKARKEEILHIQMQRREQQVEKVITVLNQVKNKCESIKKNLMNKTKQFVLKSSASVEKIENISFRDLENLVEKFVEIGGDDRKTLKREVDEAVTKMASEVQDLMTTKQNGEAEKAALMKKLEAVLSGIM